MIPKGLVHLEGSEVNNKGQMRSIQIFNDFKTTLIVPHIHRWNKFTNTRGETFIGPNENGHLANYFTLLRVSWWRKKLKNLL